MSIGGTGSPTGTTYNEGVYIDGAGTKVNTSGGLSLYGKSAGTGSNNYAVTVENGPRVYSGQDMTIFGTCTATGADANFGVNITGAGTWINSSRALSITGYGSGFVNWDYGIGVQAGASVDGYSVTLTGVGSPAAIGTMADGVFLSGASAACGAGNMHITGTGGQWASGTAGVSINGSTVYANFVGFFGGNIDVFGSAGFTGDGVDVGTGSSVWAPSGHVVLVGYGSSGPGVYRYAGNAVTGASVALIPLTVYHGVPTADATPVGDAAGGYTQTYPNGYTMLWSPSDGAHYIHGAIGAKYQSLGGPRSVFGYPSGDETPTGSGFVQYFGHPDFDGRGGSISWTPATGAQVHYSFTGGDTATHAAGQPAITGVSQDGNQITIKWSAGDNHAKFVLGYSVNGVWTQMDFAGGRGGSFTLPVTSGATYSFSIEWGDPKIPWLGGFSGYNYSPWSTYTVTAL
jgi:hypothetical protein